MSKTFISIGECMAELQATDDGLYRLGFAGDTLNTAWYMRALTRAEAVTERALVRVDVRRGPFTADLVERRPVSICR